LGASRFSPFFQAHAWRERKQESIDSRPIPQKMPIVFTEWLSSHDDA